MARQSILPVFVPHEGCPHQCVFCNQRAIAGLAKGDAQKELEDGLARLGEGACPQIAFYGGSFTAIAPERQRALLGLAQRYIKAGRASSIRVSTRPDAVGETELQRLAAYGVETVELGAQSMSDEILKRAKRGHTAADTAAAANRVRAHGFQLILQAMAGLPGETRQTAIASAKAIACLKPDGVRLYPAVVLPGTELFELWRQGEYQPLSLEQAAALCADMLEQWPGIPVLRVGLNPSEQLGAQVVAGAYHPAMGELCYNAYYLRQMERALAPYKGRRGKAVFSLHPSLVSKAVGQKRRNIRALEALIPGVQVRVVPDKAASPAALSLSFF